MTSDVYSIELTIVSVQKCISKPTSTVAVVNCGLILTLI